MTKGRPTLYRPEYADRARRAYERGAWDEDMAEELNISLAALYRWLRETVLATCRAIAAPD